MQVGFSVNMNIPRQEYPRPQFERRDWMNLNGLWQFEIDNDASGEARTLYKEGVPLCGTINVPFCPESRLSGVEHKDFIKGVWYKRTINIPDTSGKIFIHFGAADYICRIYVNGTLFLSYFILLVIFPVQALLSEFAEYSVGFGALLVVMFVITFFLYDKAIEKMLVIYIYKLRPKLIKK